MDDKQRLALVETQTVNKGSSISTPTPAQRYQFSNHLGSASLELDEAGGLISYEEYSPYGSTAFQAGRSAAEVSLKRYRYTGKERDEETGFSYHGARYYAPWLANWISPDPFWLSDGTNLYRYVNSNPVRLKDPAGTYGWQDLNSDLGRFNRAVGIGMPAVGAANALSSAISTRVTEAITGKTAPSENAPSKTLSAPERVEAATDALIAATPMAAAHHISKTAGKAIGEAIKGKISKEEAAVNIAKTEPTGIVSKTFEAAEDLDRAEIAANSGKKGASIRGYIDATLSYGEIVQTGTLLVIGAMSGGGEPGGGIKGPPPEPVSPSVPPVEQPSFPAPQPKPPSPPMPEPPTPSASSPAVTSLKPQTQPGVPRDATHPGSMFHYTDVPPEKFAGGVRPGTSFTVEGDLSTKQAVNRLGLRRAPTHVVEVVDKGQFKLANPPTVQQHPLGQGGAYDYYAPGAVPPEDIVQIHEMGRSGPRR